jgi:hypothetical protein
VIRQQLALIPAPPGVEGLHFTDTHLWACGGCFATIEGQVISHKDDCKFVQQVIDRAASAIADKASEEAAEWEWAYPIPETYTIRSPRESGGCVLHCTEHGDLFSVGEMELWEFALDAKRHHQEQHGGES